MFQESKQNLLSDVNMLEKKKLETNTFLAELKVRELKYQQDEIDLKGRIDQVKRDKLNLEAERQ